MNHFARVAALVLGLYVLQTSLLPFAAYHGISPNLMLLLTVSAAFLRGPRDGIMMGFVTGLLQDLSTGTFLGTNTLAQMLIGLFFGRFSNRVFREQFFLPVLASVPAMAADYFILALLMVLLGYRFNPVSSMQTMLLPMLIYQLAFAYPVHRLTYALDQKLREKEQH